MHLLYRSTSWVPPGRVFKIILPNGAELEMKGKKVGAGHNLGNGVDGKPLKVGNRSGNRSRAVQLLHSVLTLRKARGLAT
jgi:hypothetical protein